MASTIPVETVNGVVDSPSEKNYTLDELKTHVTRESMWILLHDKVYDVTSFMDEVGIFSISLLLPFGR